MSNNHGVEIDVVPAYRGPLFEMAPNVDSVRALDAASLILDQQQALLQEIIEDSEIQLQNVAFAAETLCESAKTLVDAIRDRLRISSSS